MTVTSTVDVISRERGPVAKRLGSASLSLQLPLPLEQPLFPLSTVLAPLPPSDDFGWLSAISSALRPSAALPPASPSPLPSTTSSVIAAIQSWGRSGATFVFLKPANENDYPSLDTIVNIPSSVQPEIQLALFD